jgi:hypothetical protein
METKEMYPAWIEVNGCVYRIWFDGDGKVAAWGFPYDRGTQKLILDSLTEMDEE